MSDSRIKTAVVEKLRLLDEGWSGRLAGSLYEESSVPRRLAVPIVSGVLG